jgi:tRNA(Ile)-lysidine synthase
VDGPQPATGLGDRFDAHLAGLRLPVGPALVAVSGGPDSLALLDLLRQSPAARPLELTVLHVDHGIQPESHAVAERVRGRVESLGVPVIVERLRLGPKASETRAREARHRVYARVLDRERANLLFTAHHADDQVETLLQRFLRGSGPAGLAGIAPRWGRLVRPLLPFRHAELIAHLREIGIDWWDDPANRELRHDRSWLRHEVLPILEARWPPLRENLLRAGGRFAEAREAWDSVLDALPALEVSVEDDGASVAVSALQGYSSPLTRSLVRALGLRAGIRVVGRHLGRIEALVAQGHTGQRLEMSGGARAELAFGRLRLFRDDGHPTEERVTVSGTRGAARFGRWTLSWEPGTGPAGLVRRSGETWVVPGGEWLVRGWRAGDRIRPMGGRCTRLVVRCMQDAKLPRSRRPEWPVLERDGTVVWVPEVCRSDAFAPAPGAAAMRIDARRD